MKKRVLLMSCTLLGLMAKAQEFDLKGKLSDTKDPLDITLEYRGQTQAYLSKDGSFEFKGSSLPTIANLKITPHNAKYTMEDKEYWKWFMPRQKEGGVRDFYLSGNVNISGVYSLDKAVITGGEEQAFAEVFLAKQNALMSSLYKISGSMDPDMENPSAAEKRIQNGLTDLKMALIQDHPDSYFSLSVVSRSTTDDPRVYQKLLDGLSDRMRSTELGKRLVVVSEGNKMNNVGNKAGDFTQYTMDGTPVTLNNFKGKYLLVDFWASWCIPCREENPNVLKAYNEFKDKNFDILSVSLDTKKANWIKAVKEDKLPWTQVSEKEEGKYNTASEIYAIKGIPSNVLIDPNGVIIAKDLRGPALEEALAKLFIGTASAQEIKFSVKGSIGNLTAPAKAYLSYADHDDQVSDSADIVNGKFTFDGKIKEPARAYLTINAKGDGPDARGADFFDLYLDKGEVRVTSGDSVRNVVISGNKLTAENNAYEKMMAQFNSRFAAIDKEYQDASPEKQKLKEFNDDLDKQANMVSKDQKAAVLAFIKTHDNSLVSLSSLDDFGGNVPDPNEVGPVFDSLSTAVRSSFAGKAYAANLVKMKNTAVGMIAPDFTQADTVGNPVSLHDFKGKYVLVDFWASWCGPCRAENPNVVEAFNTYKGKGFTVLGVSLDKADDKSQWLKAINHDQLTWTQVSDLKGSKNEAAQLYAITAIPQNFLIGPDGRIVAKSLRGDDLNKKLRELFDINN